MSHLAIGARETSFVPSAAKRPGVRPVNPNWVEPVPVTTPRFVQVARQTLTRAWQLRRQAAVLCLEGALASLAYVLSATLLLDVYGSDLIWQVLLPTLPLLIGLRLFSFVLFGSCAFSLRAASVPELIGIVKALSFSSLVFWGTTQIALDLEIPVALLILDWALATFLLAGLHFGFQVQNAQRAMRRNGGKRALIVGAGDAGTSILRDLVLDPASAVMPVGLVDDDPEKFGATICGVSVLGSVTNLARFARQYQADEVLICIPSATREQMKSILAQCRECGVPIRTLPSVTELADGRVGQKDFRCARMEDLLEREEMIADPAVAQAIVGDRVVLVTGAGGSIGSELCRQIAAGNPRKLLLLERSENSLFYINMELHERFPNVCVEPRLLDVTCRDRVRQIFESERPELVFHAAAHKHVHLMELHPYEAVRNNVLGTRNVALAARDFGTARFVNISTDKAVSPQNYMGLSKKITEQLIRELAPTSRTRFMNVRFGNVAGSTGSVLRLFRDQIEKGGPIRITDRRATRYFMTISEAVCLILQAAAQGRGGETFVFDMGKPLNIYEMARTLTLFSGLAPGKDLPIEFVGLKQGEKITEELWEPWEKPRRTSHNRIFALSGAATPSTSRLKFAEELEGLLALADYDGVVACLHRVFPEFAAQHGVCFAQPVKLGTAFAVRGCHHERAVVLS